MKYDLVKMVLETGMQTSYKLLFRRSCAKIDLIKSEEIWVKNRRRNLKKSCVYLLILAI